MKLISSLLLFLLLFANSIASDAPTEIGLTNGKILQKVSIVRWEKDAVVVKHLAGTDPVRFVNMAPQSRVWFEAQATRKWQFSGAIFVVSKGAETYRLANVAVSVRSKRGMPVVTRTDQDGRFSFTWTGPESFEIIVTTSRRIISATEHYEWTVKREQITNPDRVELSNHNAHVTRDDDPAPPPPPPLPPSFSPGLRRR